MNPLPDERSRAALVAAARKALEPTASDLVVEVLASRHHLAVDGTTLGLVVLRSEIETATAWAALAVQIAGAWAVVNACELDLSSPESPRSFSSDRYPYSLASHWLPYGDGAALGALVAWHDNPERATALRGSAVPAESLAAQPGLLLAVSWDVGRPEFKARLRPRDLELCCGEPCAWQPAAEIPRYVVSRQRFVDAYRRHSRSRGGNDADYWAWDAVFGTWDHRDKLPLVRLLIESATLEEEAHLGGLGAGPLEDMASDWLLDELGPDILADQRWLYALSMVRDFSSGGPLTDRFHRMLTRDMRHWLLAQGITGFPL